MITVGSTGVYTRACMINDHLHVHDHDSIDFECSALAIDPILALQGRLALTIALASRRARQPLSNSNMCIRIQDHPLIQLARNLQSVWVWTIHNKRNTCTRLLSAVVFKLIALSLRFAPSSTLFLSAIFGQAVSQTRVHTDIPSCAHIACLYSVQRLCKMRYERVRTDDADADDNAGEDVELISQRSVGAAANSSGSAAAPAERPAPNTRSLLSGIWGSVIGTGSVDAAPHVSAS